MGRDQRRFRWGGVNDGRRGNPARPVRRRLADGLGKPYADSLPYVVAGRIPECARTHEPIVRIIDLDGERRDA